MHRTSIDKTGTNELGGKFRDGKPGKQRILDAQEQEAKQSKQAEAKKKKKKKKKKCSVFLAAL
jgi:hypothetical protein